MLLKSWLQMFFRRCSASSPFRRAGFWTGERSRCRGGLCGDAFQRLESRIAPTTFTVTNLADSGTGSLRQAILDANQNSGADTIAFNTVATTGPGLQVISLASALPTITDAVTIDGSTQPGYAGTPLIDINANSSSSTVLYVSSASANGTTIKGLQVSGYAGIGVLLDHVTGASLQNLNVSAPGSYNAIGIQVQSNSDNVTISGVNASGTSRAIFVQSSANPTIHDNNLGRSGTNLAALYLSNVTGLTEGAVRGNDYSGDSGAIRIDNSQSGLVVGDASVSGAQIVIEDGTSGMSSVTGTALYLNGTGPSLINDIQLGYSGGARSGNGIYADSNLGGNFTIENVTATNRGAGINLASAVGSNVHISNNNLSNDGQALVLNHGTNVTVDSNNLSHGGQGLSVNTVTDLTVTNNDLSYNTGYGMSLANITASTQTWPIIASGNTFTGSYDGLELFNVGTAGTPQTIGTSGTGIVINNTTDGFQTVSDKAIWVQNTPTITISGLDLSWTGSTSRSGYGIYCDSTLTNATIQNINASNRDRGIVLVGNGQNLTVKNNNLSNDNNSLWVDNFTATGSFTTPVIASGNTVAGSSNAFVLFNMTGIYIGTSGTGIIVNNSADGFQSVSGNALWVRNLAGLTVDGLNLSYSGATQSGNGIFSDNNLGDNVLIQNVSANNRGNGIYFASGVSHATIKNNTLTNDSSNGLYVYGANGANLTVTDNNLSYDGTAMNLDSITASGAFTTPVIASGNVVTGSANGFNLYNMSSVYVGTSGTGIIVNNTTDGFQTVAGKALWIRGLPGATISGLNLSYSGTSRSGYGIYSDSNMGAGFTIQNISATNRDRGIQLGGGGQNLTVTNNNLSNDNNSLWLDSFSSTSGFTTPVIASGNVVTGSSNGFVLFNMNGIYIGTSGTGIIVNNSTDGFQTINGSALWLRNLPGLTVDGLDLSYSGGGRTGNGIFSDSNLGDSVTMQNVTANYRSNAIYIGSGVSHATINNNTLTNDSSYGLYVYGANGANLTVTNNNLSYDATAMNLDSITASGTFTTPVIASGNVVTGSTNGFNLFNMTGAYVGTSGTGIIINNSTDGFQTVTGKAFWIRNLPGATFNGLNLSYLGPNRTGYGIYSDSSLGAGVTIENVNANYRDHGIQLQSGGQNLTLTGNQLEYDNTALYLDSFTATGSFTVPVVASGNNITGSGNGFQLFNLSGQYIGASGTGIIINNSTDGQRDAHRPGDSCRLECDESDDRRYHRGGTKHRHRGGRRQYDHRQELVAQQQYHRRRREQRRQHHARESEQLRGERERPPGAGGRQPGRCHEQLLGFQRRPRRRRQQQLYRQRDDELVPERRLGECAAGFRGRHHGGYCRR